MNKLIKQSAILLAFMIAASTAEAARVDTPITTGSSPLSAFFPNLPPGTSLQDLGLQEGDFYDYSFDITFTNLSIAPDPSDNLLSGDVVNFSAYQPVGFRSIQCSSASQLTVGSAPVNFTMGCSAPGQLAQFPPGTFLEGALQPIVWEVSNDSGFYDDTVVLTATSVKFGPGYVGYVAPPCTRAVIILFVADLLRATPLRCLPISSATVNHPT